MTTLRIVGSDIASGSKAFVTLSALPVRLKFHHFLVWMNMPGVYKIWMDTLNILIILWLAFFDSHPPGVYKEAPSTSFA
jgi:hypothetical protein